MENKLLSRKNFNYLILLFFFLSINPVILKYVYPLLGYPLSFSCLTYAIFHLIKNSYIEITEYRKLYLLSLLIFAIWQMCLSFISTRTFFALNSIQFLATIIMILYAYSIDKENNLKILLTRMFAFLVTLALISLILAVIFKPLPFLIFNYKEEAQSQLVFFTFSNLYFPFNGFLRFATIFEESGTLGSYVLIILSSILSQKDKLKYSRFILFIGTLFSTSVGYILGIATFFATFLSLNLAKLSQTLVLRKKSFFLILISPLLLLLIIFFLNQLMPDYLTIRINRFQNIYEEGRFEAFITDFKSFKLAPFFGQSLKSNPGLLRGNNPFSTFAEFGIIGSFFYFLPFLIYLKYISKLYQLEPIKRNSIIFSLLTLLIHRPEIVFPSISLIIGILII